MSRSSPQGEQEKLLAAATIGKAEEEDDEAIVPEGFQSPLVLSSQLLLVTSIVALVYAIKYDWSLLYGVFATVLFLYVTSVWHWSKPRFSSLARKVDYFAVFSALVYGSFLATTLPEEYILIWFVGLAGIAVCFCVNEYLYYLQVSKSISGESTSSDNSNSNSKDGAISSSWATLPNTPEREFVYKRTVFVHLMCVHVLANSLALALIIGGEKTRE